MAKGIPSLQRKYRLMLGFALLAGVVGAVVFAAVWFWKADGEKKIATTASAATSAFCCTVDAEACTLNEYCDSNATACAACSGRWIAENRLGSEGEAPHLPTPAVAPNRGGLGGGAASSPTVSPTTAPTGAPLPTVTPTFYPTLAVTGQACLEAAKDARAVTSPLLYGIAGDTVILERSTQLCTLWQVDPTRTQIIPVGRSYGGHEWEAYAGTHDGVKFTCDPSRCSLVLPELPDGFVYELAGFDHDLPWRDQVARFLEQTTFGPTLETINSFTGSFADWILEQQTVVPMTSHRQFFRERASYSSPGNPSQGWIATQPCNAGARYRRYALTSYDDDEDLEIRTDEGTGRKILLRDGQAITVLEPTVLSVPGGGDDNNEDMTELEDGLYQICKVRSEIGGILQIKVEGLGCVGVDTNGELLSNPEVYFPTDLLPLWPILDLDEYGEILELSSEELHLEAVLNDPSCQLIPAARFKDVPVVIAVFNGQQWRFAPQIQLQDNTLADPLPDGGGELVVQTRLSQTEIESDNQANSYQMMCSNARMTFINMDSCELSYEPNTCTLRDPSDVMITLDTETIEKIYDATGGGLEGTRYLYAVQGLRQDSSLENFRPPCEAGATSRWIPSSCPVAELEIQPETIDAFRRLLTLSGDKNPLMKDITFPLSGESCNDEDDNDYGFTINVDGECWLNVHPAHLQIYDFTDWLREHPGGDVAIVTNSVEWVLEYPESHEMSRWYGYSVGYRTDVGRLGDQIRFSDLPTDLTTEEIALALDAYEALPAAGSGVVCGTPNEAKSVPFTAGKSFAGSLRMNGGHAPKKYTWLDIVMNGMDQLRQRVAWTLYQVLVISPTDSFHPNLTEPWVSYYDIFVRHAFGNYRDILKEVSFHPMMGDMLTFIDNKSTDYLWRKTNTIGFADENYAREIMQLFSIGQVKLNNDGTVKLGGNGKPVVTYTNDEITEYARVWTGFTRSGRRANIELRFGKNWVDPMSSEIGWRDSMPKLGLNGRYIGDGLPLCSELPSRHFLQKGATYVLLGSISSPRYHSEPSWWISDPNTVRTQLDEEHSALYAALCNRASRQGRNCKYPPKVVLQESLSCFGEECQMDSPRLVEVEDGVFYEYVHMPCSHQAFFSNGHAISNEGQSLTCGDSRAPMAGVGCCSQSGNNDEYTLSPTVFGHFHGEKLSWQDAQQICQDLDLELCPEAHSHCRNCDWHVDYWTSKTCSQQVKISTDGRVGLVHSLGESEASILGSVSEETKTFFHVVWSLPNSMNIVSLLSDYEGLCSSLGCTRDAFDNLCLCPVQVVEEPAFNDAPTHKEVLEELSVGAFDPSIYWGPHPVLEFEDGVRMHSLDGLYSTDSVFEVVDDNGLQQFRKNIRSEVLIGSPGGFQLSFRNPLHLISIHSPDLRDMLFETDAALDHYFYHPNTAPFLAVRFAQRFGLSNPSPRLVDRVATAFRDGGFVDESSGTSFGSGEYGDLGAMVAALLLDRESRQAILDADPTHGSLQEPLLRYIRTMRSLEFGLLADQYFIKLRSGLADHIGQGPHEIPSVFSFFLPEHQPQGPVGDSGLVCPECQVLAGPQVVNLMNGLLSLLKYGLDTAYEGLASDSREDSSESIQLGVPARALGFNWYVPTEGLDAAGVVDELATLLTSGRLSAEKRELLQAVYAESSLPESFINVQQLIATTPEFHTTGLARGTGEVRPEVTPPIPAAENYRAVLHLRLGGGMDSYNLLIPAECQSTDATGQTVDAQYQTIRGSSAIKMTETDLRISVDPSLGQPCTTFAIHPDAGVFKELYDEGSLLFFANVGQYLSTEMNKANYREYMVSGGFGHNTMSSQVYKMDPLDEELGTGVLGRMHNTLRDKGFSTSAISINTPSPDMNGAQSSMVVSQSGSTRFNPRPGEEDLLLLDLAAQLNSLPEGYSSVFGETWSREFLSGVANANSMSDLLDETSVDVNGISSNLEMVARLIQTKDARGVDRDFFKTGFGSWDHHSNMKPRLSLQLESLNNSLGNFVAQLKSQGSWDDIVVVISSEFGRKITPNGSEGSDHGWAGHYAVLGGGVRGGRILGQYPPDLTPTGPYNLGTGRMMPTMGWESIWNGIGQWMGVESAEEFDYVLPNLHNVYGNGFFGPYSRSDMFLDGSTSSTATNVFGT